MERAPAGEDHDVLRDVAPHVILNGPVDVGVLAPSLGDVEVVVEPLLGRATTEVVQVRTRSPARDHCRRRIPIRRSYTLDSSIVWCRGPLRQASLYPGRV